MILPDTAVEYLFPNCLKLIEITLAISCKTGETELKRLAIKNGMKTMTDDGLIKMNQISLSELIRVLPLEMIKEFKNRH